MSVTITGASDDLIEIEGDISEEFNVYDTHNVDRLLAFSDGTVLRVRCTDEAVWRITPEHRTSTSGALTITQAVPGDETNYTDRAVIDGPVTWVVLGSEIAVPVTRPVGTVRGG
jgi:hypothetical protein